MQLWRIVSPEETDMPLIFYAVETADEAVKLHLSRYRNLSEEEKNYQLSLAKERGLPEPRVSIPQEVTAVPLTLDDIIAEVRGPVSGVDMDTGSPWNAHGGMIERGTD